MRLRHKPAWSLQYSPTALVLATTTFIDNANGYPPGSLESVNTRISSSSTAICARFRRTISARSAEKANRPARTG